ncbi:MAG: hypothetical protein QG622_933 [Actinomycetota bacterium]|nr:hypothetical protein [Actinomycetota bacterium]
MSEILQLPFSNARSGEGELSWGQLELWLQMRRSGSFMPVGAFPPVPDGIRVEDLAAAAQRLVHRFDALRTRVTVSPDGHPRQMVAASGVQTIELLEDRSVDSRGTGTDPGTDPGLEAYLRFKTTPMDLERDLPLRVAIVHRKGIARQAVIVFTHLVTDGLGLIVLGEELLRELLHPKGPAAQNPAARTSAPQALDLARWQGTPEGRAVSDTALAGWAATLSQAPLDPAPRSPAPGTHRYQELHLTSPALHGALTLLSSRNLHPASVLMAAQATAAAELTGTSPVLMQLLVHNRFRPGLARSIAPLTQSAPCLVDPRGEPFLRLTRRVMSLASAAVRQAYHDPIECDAIIAEADRARGGPSEFTCWHINDRRQLGRSAADWELTPFDTRDVRGLSSLISHRTVPFGDGRIYLHVEEKDGKIVLVYSVDTHAFTIDQCVTALRRVEQLVVDAVYQL